jgi:hypothetical protein
VYDINEALAEWKGSYGDGALDLSVEIKTAPDGKHKYASYSLPASRSRLPEDLLKLASRARLSRLGR